MKLFSKSDFTKGCQCPKMLWMDLHHPELFDPSLQDDVILAGGDEIGEMAKYHLGNSGDVTIRQTFDFGEMARETTIQLFREARTVFEATFVYKGLVCMADCVVPRQRSWHCDVYEVKGSSHIKPYHLQDLAYQVYVIEKAGWHIDNAYLVHVNGDYRLHGFLDYDALFTDEDVTDQIRSIIADGIDGRIADFMAAVQAADAPGIACGKHCNSPHPCGYQGTCCGHVPGWLFSMAGIGRSKAIELAAKGVRTADDLAGMKLTGLQRSQIDAGESGATVNPAKLAEFLDGIEYPVAYLDFETIQTAVPKYEGTGPWAQVPTQFSLHVLSEDGALTHAEHLAPAEGDPRRGVAEALIAAVPETGTVLAYNMSFEKTRISELAAAFDDLAPALLGINERVQDLIVPFKKGWLYLPAQQGSCSIKRVLPALFPDDPELDYHSLSGVHNGTEAISAFASLSSRPAEEQRRVRRQLLDYCCLDTLAMVRVHEALRTYAGVGERHAAAS